MFTNETRTKFKKKTTEHQKSNNLNRVREQPPLFQEGLIKSKYSTTPILFTFHYTAADIQWP